jgi:hypothetical protein
MEEPKRIKLSDFNPSRKEPIKLPLKSETNVNHLYDEFGYVTSVEIIKNEDSKNGN